jgi:hypothetical protein
VAVQLTDFQNQTASSRNAIQRRSLRFGNDILNDWVAAQWPYVNDWFTNLMHTSVEPLLKSAMPSGMTIRFGDRCDLGCVPLRLEDPSTATYTQKEANTISGEHEDITNLLITGDLAFTSDAEIEVVVPSIGKLAIQDLSMSGKVCIELVRLTTTPPWFSGVRVYFPNAPSIDAKVKSRVLGVSTNFAFIKRILVQALSSIICGSACLPNRFAVALAPDLDVFHLRHPRPQGVLRVRIIEASGLRGASSKSFRNVILRREDPEVASNANTAEPFVEVMLGANTRTTSSKSGLDSVSWENEAVFDFIVSDVASQQLCIKVRDADSGFMSRKTTDHLGSGAIDVSELVDGEPLARHDIKLYGTGLLQRLVHHGTVALQVQWRTFGDATESFTSMGSTISQRNAPCYEWRLGNPNSCAWLLIVNLFYATGLPAVQDSTKDHWVDVIVEGDGVERQERTSGRIAGNTPEHDAFEKCIQSGLTEKAASALKCDAALARESLLDRRATDFATSAKPNTLVDVVWETPFTFLLEDMEKAIVKVNVKRPCAIPEKGRNSTKNPGEGEDEFLGSVRYDIRNLMGQTDGADTVHLHLEDGAAKDVGLVKMRLLLSRVAPSPAQERNRAGSRRRTSSLFFRNANSVAPELEEYFQSFHSFERGTSSGTINSSSSAGISFDHCNSTGSFVKFEVD